MLRFKNKTNYIQSSPLLRYVVDVIQRISKNKKVDIENVTTEYKPENKEAVINITLKAVPQKIKYIEIKID